MKGDPAALRTRKRYMGWWGHVVRSKGVINDAYEALMDRENKTKLFLGMGGTRMPKRGRPIDLRYDKPLDDYNAGWQNVAVNRDACKVFVDENAHKIAF